MKRALFCFMVISFFLCLGGYGQAAQVMDRVSLTVQNVVVEKDVNYDEEAMSKLMGQTIYLFSVIYDNESTESHRWNNDTGELEDTFGPDDYMTFLSDALYSRGDGLLRILNIFNYSLPSYPNVRQVYNDTYYDGLPYVTEENPGTTYDYQIEEGVCGVLFNYYSNNDSASGHIDFIDGEGRSASVQFWGDYTVQRVISNINKGVVIGDDVLVEEDVVINKNSEIAYHVSIYSGTIVNQGVVIGDYVVVGSDVTIGKGTNIGQWVKIGNGTVIGKDCTIEDDVEIGDRVVIGRNVTVTSGTKIDDDTVIGKELTVPPLP